MMRIAVCDDEFPVCLQIEKIIESFARNESVQLSIDVFSSGERLLKELKEGGYYDLLFLDIELKKTNGIDTGIRIREELQHDFMSIVYISSYSQYAMELFQVCPLDFLLKPIKPEQVIRAVKKVMRLLRITGEEFVYRYGGEVNKILMRDILYFKSEGRNIRIRTRVGENSFNGSLSRIFEQVGPYNFFFSHKSFIVNYYQVKEFYYERLIMKNGDEIPIAQARRKEVREIQKKIERREIADGDCCV